MNRYKVRVWIDDFEVEANNEEEAANIAIETIDDELNCTRADYAEVQQILVDGEWKHVNWLVEF